MIFAILLIPFWLLIDLLLRILPTVPSLSIGVENINSILDVIGYGIYIIGSPCFLLCLTTIIFWSSFHLYNAVISWGIAKLPFFD